jgi:hypothetical protein
MLILNSDHVKSVLMMKDYLEGYRGNAVGRKVNNRRTHLHMPEPMTMCNCADRVQTGRAGAGLSCERLLGVLLRSSRGRNQK